MATATCGAAFADGGPSLDRLASGGLFAGEFVIDHITDPLDGIQDTDAFDAIEGRAVLFTIAFDFIARELYSADADGGKRWIVTTGPARATFLGDVTGYLQNVIAPTLACGVQIEISEDPAGNHTLEAFEIVEAQAPQYFRFMCRGPIQLATSRLAVRIEEPGLDTNVMRLQRFSGSPRVTDSAMGTARYALFENTPVSVEPRTFGEIKAMYRTLE